MNAGERARRRRRDPPLTSDEFARGGVALLVLFVLAVGAGWLAWVIEHGGAPIFPGQD